MAISDLSLFNSMAIALDTTTANIQNIQQSLASGKRVVQPSDDLVNYGGSVAHRAKLRGHQ